MPSTYSRTGLELMVTGEKNNAWGGITNLNLEMLEELAGGVAVVTMGDTSALFNITQANLSPGRNAVVVVESSVSLTTSRELRVPENTPRPYIFHNKTLGAQNIVVKTTAGTGVVVPNGAITQVYATSTTVYEVGGAAGETTIFRGIADGATDNTALLQAALSVVALTNDVLYIPSGTYQLDAPVTIPVSVGGMRMAPGATFKINHNGVGLDTLSGTTRRFRRRFEIDAYKATQSDWLLESCIGFRGTNFMESELYIRRLEGFTIGFQALGDNTGWSYNDILLGRLLDNKIHLDIRTSGAGSWNNENLYRGGRFTNNPGVNTSIDRTGVRFSTNSGYLLHNNNVFLKPSFEMDASISCAAYAVRDEVNATNNTFQWARVEDQSKTLIFVSGGGAGNFFEVGYNGTSVSVEVTTPNLSISQPWFVLDGSLQDSQRAAREVFAIPSIKTKVIPYVSYAGVEGLLGMTLGTHTVGTSIRAHVSSIFSETSVTENGVQIGSSRAFGVYVNTEEVKRYYLDYAGGGGRPVVMCYDVSDNIIDTSALPVRMSRGTLQYNAAGIYWWGTADRSDAANNNKSEIILPAEAKRAFIGVARGSADVSLESFRLSTSWWKAPPVIPVLESTNRGSLYYLTPSVTATTAIDFPVPSLDNFTIRLNGINGQAGGANAFLQLSFDGGATFTSGTAYVNSGVANVNNAVAIYQQAMAGIFCGYTNTSGGNQSEVHFKNHIATSPSYLTWLYSNMMWGGGSMISNNGCGFLADPGTPPTHMRLLSEATSLMPGGFIEILR